MKISHNVRARGQPVATGSTRRRPVRSKVRISVAGARVWVFKSQATACRSALELLRASQTTWNTHAWAKRVVMEVRSNWDGQSHGGCRRSMSRQRSACGDLGFSTGIACAHAVEAMDGPPTTVEACPGVVVWSACGDSTMPVCGKSHTPSRGDSRLDGELSLIHI